METIKHNINIPAYGSKIFNDYFGGLKAYVIDIETDGLNPSYNQIIIGGLLSQEENRSTITQYFAEKKDDEKELLQAYGNALADADILITYNGDSFDLEFLKKRFKKYGLNSDLAPSQSFDLYRILHRYSKLRDVLPNLKQKSIEHFLGLSNYREDELSGRDSVRYYKSFLRSSSEGLKTKILLHNKDDLIQLYSILRILDKLNLHKIMFHEGFTVFENEKRLFIKNISMKKNLLEVNARSKNIALDYYSFETAYQAIHRAKEREFTLTIPFESKEDADFIDLYAFDADFKTLESYPGYESGFLLLREDRKIYYGEINKAIKIILTKILNQSML